MKIFYHYIIIFVLDLKYLQHNLNFMENYVYQDLENTFKTDYLQFLLRLTRKGFCNALVFKSLKHKKI